MNCRPGDLAVIIRAKLAEEHIGKIVEVVRLSSDSKGIPGWVTTPELTAADESGEVYYCLWRDDSLQPIRDQPGDDVTLSWAPVPSEVMA